MTTISTLTITNVSNQTVPILVSSVTSSNSSAYSTIPASRSQSLPIAAGSQIVIESSRISIGQLEELRRKNLISYQ